MQFLSPSSPRTTGRHPGRRIWRAVCLASLPLLLLAAGCGVGSSSGAPAFQIAGVGPGGGVVAAGDVRLTLAPGALAQTTAVSILPQATPFTIQPAGQDPCTYTYLGPLWCCGPVGHDLLVASVMRISYDESLIPAGFTETDLVLLRWDNMSQVMVPNFAATQNVTLNYFEDTNYVQLGHIAVGVRDCRGAGQVIVAGNGGQVGAITDGMYVLPIDGSTQDFLSGETPFNFIPSLAGGRIAFEDADQSESTLIGTIPIAGGATTFVADTNDNVDRGDPYYGWMRQSPANRAFFMQYRPTQVANLDLPALLDPNEDQSVFVRRRGDAGDAITAVHGISFSGGVVKDLRQSPDGNHLLFRYGSFSTQGGPDTIEIVNTTTGAVVSSGLIPEGGGQQTPRFTPDSAGVYGVSTNQTSVVLTDLDGTNAQVIFAFGPGQVQDTIEDAVLAPDGLTMAVIVRGVSTDFLYLARPDVPMMGVVLDTFDLTLQGVYSEMFWNPVAQDVLYIAERSNVQPYQMDAAASPGSRITQHPLLPVQGLSRMDVDAGSGELLHLTVGGGLTDLSDAALRLPEDPADTQATTGPGVCVTDAIGGDLRIVPPFGLTIYAARWLNTIRNVPGMFGDQLR